MMMMHSGLCLLPPLLPPSLPPLSLPGLHTASSPLWTNEMTIGGSSCAPSESHRGSASAGRQAGGHDTDQGRVAETFRISRISYEHPRRQVEANARTP